LVIGIAPVVEHRGLSLAVLLRLWAGASATSPAQASLTLCHGQINGILWVQAVTCRQLPTSGN
jgi:hypothetical protein